MRQTRDELLNKILELDNPDDLFEIKYELEIQPFCGIEQCYDIERFIFHILTIQERELVIEHIKEISIDIQQRIHIFTTYDYYSQSSDKIKYFLKVNSDFITIISNKSEVYEIGIRNRNIDNITYISDIDLRIDQKGNIPHVSDVDELDHDIVSQSLADLYFRTIINYTNIFPEFIPLFIDFATNANIILANKLNIIASDTNMAGCILDNSQDIIPDNFENIESGIYFFKTDNEFMKIFVNNILD